MFIVYNFGLPILPYCYSNAHSIQLFPIFARAHTHTHTDTMIYSLAQLILDMYFAAHLVLDEMNVVDLVSAKLFNILLLF